MKRTLLAATLLALGLGCAAGRIDYVSTHGTTGQYSVAETGLLVRPDGIRLDIGHLEWSDSSWILNAEWLMFLTAPGLVRIEVELPRALEEGRTYPTQADAEPRCRARGLFFGSGWKPLHGALRVISWDPSGARLRCRFKFAERGEDEWFDGIVHAPAKR